MGFPIYRPRRLRATENLRSMIRETELSVNDLIYPLFVVPGTFSPWAAAPRRPSFRPFYPLGSERRNKMFNRKSSYALNKKDPDAIVYMDANEVIIRLTREDFASEEEFLKWKSLSDADYHASEKEDHVYANHTLALDELSEEAASIPAADICMEQAHDRVAEIRRSTQKVTQIRKHLTDTQFRRMWMYFVDGMTIDEIGKVEGVSHQAISLNITAAIRKIKKYF
mgnify:CR=1 FL=1